MKNWNICRIVLYSCIFDHLKFIYMKLFQNLIIPGYVEGLHHNFKTLTCKIVDQPLEEIIQQKLFKTKLFHNLVDTLEYFLQGIPHNI